MDVAATLQALGYNAQWGYDWSDPATLNAAIRQFQADNNLTVDGIVGPQTTAALEAAAGGGGGAAPGGGGSTEDIIHQRYAYMEWALSIPEVGDILRRAAGEGWDGTRLQGAIEATSWWKTTSAAARQWQQLQSQDPATAADTKAQLLQQAQDLAANYEATGLDLNAIVDMALKTGTGASGIAAMIRSQSNYYARERDRETAARTNQLLGTVQGLSRDYAIPLSMDAMQKWATQLAQPGANLADFENYVREQAKSLFPGLAAAIDRGVTVRQYVEPYLQIYAKELGTSPENVDLTDPQFNQALNQIDPKTGTRVSMSLDQWTATVRSDPRLGYDGSQNGQTVATQLAQALQQRLGNAA